MEITIDVDPKKLMEVALATRRKVSDELETAWEYDNKGADVEVITDELTDYLVVLDDLVNQLIQIVYAD